MDASNLLLDANDLSEALGISKGYAYKLIKEMNKQLKTDGYLTISGKVPRAYWEARFFGYKRCENCKFYKGEVDNHASIQG